MVVLMTATLLTSSVQAQIDAISRHEADSMLALLPNTKAATQIETLLNLAQFHIFKAGENKIDLDSGQTYIDQAIALNKKNKSADAAAYILVNQSYLERERGARETGFNKAGEAVRLLRNSQLKGLLGRALYELSMYYSYQDSIQRAVKMNLVSQAVEAFQLAGDTLRMARSLEMLGDLTFVNRNRHQSLQLLLQSLALYDSIGYPKVQDVGLLIGELYFQLDEYVLSIHYYFRSLRAATLTGDSSIQMYKIHHGLAMIYHKIGRNELAASYYKQALTYAKKVDESFSIALTVCNAAYIYCENQPVMALQILRDYPLHLLKEKDSYTIKYAYYRIVLVSNLRLQQREKAQQACNQLLALDKEAAFPAINRGSLNRYIATFYLYTGQNAKAQHYLDISDEWERRVCTKCEMSRNLQLHYKLDSARRDYQAAFHSLSRYKEVTDSIFSENNLRQLQVAGIEYEVAQKEDSIKLKDKNIINLQLANDLQKADLRQANLLTYLTIAGILAALLIIALLYRQYRNKQRSNAIISQKNEQLEGLVIEKEWLLKEIHHRVKNNFQTVMSLLGTQSAYLKNDVAISAINDSQQRIQAMLLIHQRLYKSNNLSSVRIQDYLHELVESLSESYADSDVRFQLQIAPVEFDLAHCIPLGLILNEAITNAYKYAFPDKRAGLISITLANTTGNHYQLTIQDNGIGLPPGFDIQRLESMGINLMRGLVREISGSFTLSGSNGTTITISFPYEPVPTMADHAAYA